MLIIESAYKIRTGEKWERKKDKLPDYKTDRNPGVRFCKKRVKLERKFNNNRGAAKKW